MNSDSSVLRTLAKSEFVRDYERAFGDATGLPVSVVEREDWQPALHGKRHENPFCALIVRRSKTCAACLRCQSALRQIGQGRPSVKTCPYGLTEAEIPIRVGAEAVGYLVTGQVFREIPTEAQFEKVAEKLDASVDKRQAHDAYFASPVVSKRRFESSVHLLSLFAEHLSLKANQMVVQTHSGEPSVVTKAKHYLEEHIEEDLALGEVARADYQDKPLYFVDRLAQGIAMIAAAFYPKDVILRLSDFKTNEYANLIGGSAYEPLEENPMLGFRGASRYYHPRYVEGFALECRAVLKVRKEMGLTNLKVMIPFCRTVEEGRLVQEEMKKHGLQQGADGLEIYVMCEIPSNVLLADQFAEIFDGFSIGSNDLTQLILGVDRDSEIVAPIFDERNPAVKEMIAKAISTCRAMKRKIGICGQAPSDYPEFTRFLVDLGIDSISLNPDTVLKTTLVILQEEDKRP